MSNSLTGLDPAFLSQDMNTMNNLEKKYKNSTPNPEGKTFSELMKEKIDKAGNVIQSKLDPREKKLYGTCVEMESMLWKQVLNEMKKTTGKYKLLDGGQAEEIFTDFLYDEYSSMMAKNSGTKISDQMFKQLSGYR